MARGSALSAPALSLVFAGGVVGTSARAWVTSVWPGWVALTLVNLLGAFVLGWFLARLRQVRAAAGPDAHQGLQWFVATGVLGAFTTYGTLAGVVVSPAAAAIAGSGTAADAVLALLAALAQVGLGVLMAWLGWCLGDRRRAGRCPHGSVPTDRGVA